MRIKGNIMIFTGFNIWSRPLEHRLLYILCARDHFCGMRRRNGRRNSGNGHPMQALTIYHPYNGMVNVIRTIASHVQNRAGIIDQIKYPSRSWYECVPIYHPNIKSYKSLWNKTRQQTNFLLKLRCLSSWERYIHQSPTKQFHGKSWRISP